MLEAEAILAILTMCEQDKADLVVSDIIVFESNNNPNPQKRAFVTEILRQAKEYFSVSDAIEQRAIAFEQDGIKAMDALHLALAEAAKFITFVPVKIVSIGVQPAITIS
jgi:hypothetical protein